MTDFQMSLIAAGGVFVVGVITYNKWQEYKARKTVERAFASDHDDVLMRSGSVGVDRQEPVLDVGMPGAEAMEPSFGAPSAAAPDLGAVGGSAGAGAGTVAAASAALEPAAPPPGVTAPGVTAGPAPAEVAESLVDPLIDCMIPLALEGAARGDKILPSLLKLRRVGNKPIHFIGLAVSGDWEPIVHGGVYTELQAGVQLATRTTALNELEYSELVTRLRAVADEIGAEPAVPDMIEVMSEARTLHKFVAGHDAQLGVNLKSNGPPWPMATLIGALEKVGFDVRPDGRFAMPDGHGGVLFTLSTNVNMGAENTDRLTLLLDVPCVAPSRDGFGAMVKCAKELVGRLDATIVDDFEQPLLDASLEEIAGQVKEFYEEMEASDIPAGSTRALRLFS
ncbi:cell division protein ZipA C-terminal FtsZ-binding domain-containing protein [Massilia sp. YIM B02769]|uniref:cell division protein ZipA C-terminal FtsZ-binding domain-containing protein n=1 Tax=unclassified Massilia TaxID=2609279 RepID=UPI0025B7331B|nr:MULTISPECIES: cell division protein ZipA C-terminal FtsZ-binding domain-containing protein [unclassified Massilia]MDN4060163.1 cell division protein ZipA C-terminal FtsZ-binding domain-containing protein [Massilia sp. YIM B02769]